MSGVLLRDEDKLTVDLADPIGHAAAMLNLSGEEPLEWADIDGAPAQVIRDTQVICEGVELLERLAGHPSNRDDFHATMRVLDRVEELGRIDDQATYEAAHESLHEQVVALDERLATSRFLGSERPSAADYLAFAFSVRLDLVFYELFKASIGLLRDFSNLHAHACDMFERIEVRDATDFELIKERYYSREPVLNPRTIVPRGGDPDLHVPHSREFRFAQVAAAGIEEDQSRSRGDGEWVRPQSELRHWVRPAKDARFPAEAGRYHLYAPYNCPWSHRALLARSVKGLDDVVGASIVYFRRDPENGWQFNPAIPGCTPDLAEGGEFVVERYQESGSNERSVPVLWDTKSKTIVNNESADILRMFNDAFGDLATRAIDLYPEGFRNEIDRLNAAVYQRINNGAYKAGFASSQQAYDLAFRRYFRALRWLDELLGERMWLAGTDQMSEADLRLFPTIFRHDSVYFSRFKLNQSRLREYPNLTRWLQQIMNVPGVAQASSLDHARNGYFGRSGNEIVPAGPSPLQLSRKDYPEAVWLNRSGF